MNEEPPKNGPKIFNETFFFSYTNFKLKVRIRRQSSPLKINWREYMQQPTSSKEYLKHLFSVNDLEIELLFTDLKGVFLKIK